MWYVLLSTYSPQHMMRTIVTQAELNKLCLKYGSIHAQAFHLQEDALDFLKK